MASIYTVIIPINPHIKQYLIRLYGPEPITFPKKHRFNTVLIRVLDKPAVNSVNRTKRGSNSVEIVLPYNNVKDIRSYNYLGLWGIKHFRKAVWLDFMCDFEQFVKEQKLCNVERKDAVLDFMDIMNISEDDISFNAFYRNFSRLQQKHRQRKLTAMSVKISSLNPTN